MASRVALVTGGNKGIGLQICRQLVFKNWKVILGTRTLDNGSKALQHFDNENFPRTNLDIVQLDITDDESIKKATEYVQSKYNSKIDVLVNNAGIAFRANQFNERIINKTLETNLYGTIKVTKAFLPYVSERICFISSRAGALQQYSKKHIDQFLSDNLTEHELYSMIDQFKKDAAELNYAEPFEFEDRGWTMNAYALSKAAVSMYSRMLARDLFYKHKRRVFVATYCPGYCRTDLTNHTGERSAVEGAYGASTLCSMLLDYEDNDKKIKEYNLAQDDVVPFDAPYGAFWSAFYAINGDLNSIELEPVDWINPAKTLSWQNILHNIVIRRGKK